MSGDGAGAAGSRRGPAGWLRHHLGLVVVLVVPPVLFLAPLVAGRAFLDGDNFLQNFPLRVLVADDLRQGALPLMNPYLFSGTPLLGGFNAGAAYPATWLLALLPRFVGWSLNLALAYDVAALGTYLFLRRQSLSAAPAAFAAATFAFAGYMSAQVVHVDLVEAAAWLPWTLLAVDALLPAGRGGGRPLGPGSGAASWAVLLAATVGLTALTGGAEVIIDGLIGVLVYAVWKLAALVRAGTALAVAARSAGWMLGGVAVGLALGAAQLLPGLIFHSHSQRAAASYQFFTTGSLDYHLLALLVSPFVLGTNQNTPTPYVGQYNLPEVTSYVGVLALIATCVLLTRRFRRRSEAPRWRVWYAIGAFGLLSALGGETPFGHLLYLVPVVRGERLLNRNLLLVDFSMAVLLAWWLQVLLERRPVASSRGLDPGEADADGRGASLRPVDGRTGRRLRHAIGWAPGRRSEILLTALPAAIMVVAACAMWADAPLVLRLLNATTGIGAASQEELAGLVSLGAAIGVSATVLVLLERHMSPVALRRALAGVLACDLAVLAGFLLHAPVGEGAAQAATPQAAALARSAAGGRFLVYDPDQFFRGDLYALGQTDLNVFPETASGQGYTALTDGAYYQATGAHFQEDLDPASLRGSLWDDLDATTLLSLPSYFVTPLGPAPATGSSVPFPADPSAAARDYTGAPMPTDSAITIAPGRSRVWYLGGVLTVSGWSLLVEQGSPADLEASVVAPEGAMRQAATGSAEGRLVVPGPVARIAGVAVRNRSSRPVVVGVPIASTQEAGPVALDGRMQYGVDSSHWRFVGTIGPFGVFENRRARGWAWATSPGGGAPPTGATVVAGAPAADGSQRITVRSPVPIELVRSMSWTTGWTASAEPAGGRRGPGKGLVVRRAGLVQRVTLPTGAWTVRFAYRPAGAVAGMALSTAAAVLLLAGLVADATVLRRRRRARVEEEDRLPATDDQAGERSPMAWAARP